MQWASVDLTVGTMEVRKSLQRRTWGECCVPGSGQRVTRLGGVVVHRGEPGAGVLVHDGDLLSALAAVGSPGPVGVLGGRTAGPGAGTGGIAGGWVKGLRLCCAAVHRATTGVSLVRARPGSGRRRPDSSPSTRPGRPASIQA